MATIIIRRQLLEVELRGTEAEGHTLHRRLSQVCGETLPSILERLLEPFDTEDVHRSIDRLDIDLAGMSLTHFEQDLVGALTEEIGRAFRNAQLQSRTVESASGARQRTRREAIDAALLGFLRTGRLAWWFDLAPGSTLEAQIVGEWERSGVTAAATGAALRLVLSDHRARVRLRSQFSLRFVGLVLQLLSPGAHEVLSPWSESGNRVMGSAVDAFVERLSDEALSVAAASIATPPRSLVRRAWYGVAPWVRADAALATTLERHWPGVTTAIDTPTPKPEAASEFARTEDAVGALPSTEDVDDERGGIVVANAGIVLLHPFVTQCFDTLAIADGPRLVDHDRALSLLHYVATGERIAPEHDLVLAKVLCGMPLDEPVRAEVGLTTAEVDEADAMLAAAIEHWTALRGSGPDAVRFEYLMRPGRLMQDGDGDWQLTVESRSVDILLDQLPWGLSVIRLPWMSPWLRVDWMYS